MDGTYKETVTAQIQANTQFDINVKQGMLDILKYFGEDELQQMTKPIEWRFFYKGDEQEVANKLLDSLPKSKITYLQGQINRLAREGRADENAFLNKYFKTTYKYGDEYYTARGYKGHHKYDEGVRIY